ncbi:hypothetical protein [uncultured Maribacter sp.]|uniref:hypothetical protein n=1 Tax=uncultured Maribacter sp. TaxID=431308 RepID=UPI002607D31B|nr:hypothetical protein [uncultured Maribacter sp.]
MKKVFLKKTRSNYYSIPFIILITILSIFIASCSKNDDQPPVVITKISEDIKELIYFQGDEKASTVLINVQEGPDTKLDASIVDLIFNNTNATDLLVANVHQAQTLDSTIVKGNDITLEQAITYSAKSIETLDQVLSYFKGQGRTVYVFGNSFGAFMTQELIAKKGINSADKYLIMTGRLDINDVIWQALAEGNNGYFESGVTPIIDAELVTDIKEKNLNKMTAALGKNRYTQLLNTIEDLSKVTYIYGKNDQAVGSLTAEEVQFLESKNATVISGNGGHGETFFEFVVQGFKDAFGIEILLQ